MKVRLKKNNWVRFWIFGQKQLPVFGLGSAIYNNLQVFCKI